MPPHITISLEEAQEKQRRQRDFAAQTLGSLVPLLEKCPGHWFRDTATAIHLDLAHLQACFDAYLDFQQTALFSGVRIEDFPTTYNELRERDPAYTNPATAPWSNPFAAALALKEWVDTTTMYLKMMRDCVDITVIPPWGKERDLWGELGVEGRTPLTEWFDRYNSKQPGTGTGEWKPSMRGDLADEQAKAWGLPTTEDMEIKLGLRKAPKEAEKQAEERRSTIKAPSLVFRRNSQQVPSPAEREPAKPSGIMRTISQRLSSMTINKGKENPDKIDKAVLNKNDKEDFNKTCKDDPTKNSNKPKRSTALGPGISGRYYRPAHLKDDSDYQNHTDRSSAKQEDQDHIPPAKPTPKIIPPRLRSPGTKPRARLSKRSQLLPQVEQLSVLEWHSLTEKEKRYMAMIEEQYPAETAAIRAQLRLVNSPGPTKMTATTPSIPRRFSCTPAPATLTLRAARGEEAEELSIAKEIDDFGGAAVAATANSGLQVYHPSADGTRRSREVGDEE